MKLRKGFVSNSSSSSFVLSKELMSENQMDKIRNHIKVAQEMFEQNHAYDFGYVEDTEAWEIDELPETMRISTWMNNFDMYEFIDAIKVPREAISKEWEG